MPKKEKHEAPKIIKKESLRKSLLNQEDFDDAQDFKANNKFTEKIIKTRNFNTIKHMIKKNVNLPSIAWQANLRAY